MGARYATHMRRAVKNLVRTRVECVNAIGHETSGIKDDAALHAMIRVIARAERTLEDLIARAESAEPTPTPGPARLFRRQKSAEKSPPVG